MNARAGAEAKTSQGGIPELPYSLGSIHGFRTIPPRGQPQFYLAARGEPISVPMISPETTISTRRFCCRPAAVSFEATG